MLNLSPSNKITARLETRYSALKRVNRNQSIGIHLSVKSGLLFLLLILLISFLPWTQNINATGTLTSLLPEQRPQNIIANIDGRIEKWYVYEGRKVNKGDTIAFISEIKDDYIDKNLLKRTQEQLSAKQNSRIAYTEKIAAINDQILFLNSLQRLKIEQTQNKIKQTQQKLQIDSQEYYANVANNEIALKQWQRWQSLTNKGLKSTTDLELKELKYKEVQSKLQASINKIANASNELLNSKLEYQSVLNDYREKIAKANSDLATARSSLAESDNEIAKLKNKVSNYQQRAKWHHIIAPQSGYITQAFKAGIGEIIKTGETIFSIAPTTGEFAVEAYVKPMDIPLLQKNQKVRLRFDGWPAFIFSGWPGVSFGTFGGSIYSIDHFSNNGKFRIWIRPNNTEQKWPKELRLGSGSEAIILLKNVPIWYEVWRQLNGFPAEFYSLKDLSKNKVKNDK